MAACDSRSPMKLLAKAVVSSKCLTGEDPLPGSLTWLLAGLYSLQTVGMRPLVPHWLLARDLLSSMPHGLLHGAAHKTEAGFLRTNEPEKHLRHLFPVSQDSLFLIDRCPGPQKTLLHILCPVWGWFKAWCICGICYPILTRSEGVWKSLINNLIIHLC